MTSAGLVVLVCGCFVLISMGVVLWLSSRELSRQLALKEETTGKAIRALMVTNQELMASNIALLSENSMTRTVVGRELARGRTDSWEQIAHEPLETREATEAEKPGDTGGVTVRSSLG